MRTNLILKGGAVALGLAAMAGTANATLAMYDDAIAADNAGALQHTAILTTPVVLDGTFGSPFDFGAVSGSSTAEFIITGDPNQPGDPGRNGFLAVGANGTWNLRYEQWDDTGQLGFTHLGVADNLFVPPVASPTETAHVAYRWDQTTDTMDVYVNGDLAGSQTAAGYEMPSGAGFLGAKDAAGAEAMFGTFHRVTIYDSAIDPAVIKAHSDAAAVPEPSSALLGALGVLFLGLRRKR